MMKHNRIWKLIACCLCVALIATLVAFVLPGSADASKNFANTYALAVTAGSNGGEYVQQFVVHYRDEDGTVREEAVMPHEGGLYNSLMFAKEHSVDGVRTEILAKLGISAIGPVAESVKALQPGKRDTYFFTPQQEVDKIIGVDIVFRADAPDLGEWTVQDLSVYKVDQIHALEMLGYYGNDYSPRFSGKRVAYLQSDELVTYTNFAFGASMVYNLSMDEAADKKLVLTSDKYEMSADLYHVSMDFADAYGAGFETLTQPYDQKNGLLNAGFGEMLVMQIDYLDVNYDTCRTYVPVITAAMGTMLELGASPEMLISGLAQQGDCLGFNCYLREFKSILTMKLYSGESAQHLTSLPILASESARVSAVRLHCAEGVMVSFDNARADAPTYTCEADALATYTSAEMNGDEIPSDMSCALDFSAKQTVNVADRPDTYMIEFRSDAKYISDIPYDLYIQINYRSVLGEEMTTDPMSVRELVKDYYGFWPASDENFAYYGLICSNEGLRMFLDLADVDCFTGIVLSTEEAYNDFAIKNFAISKVYDKNRRTTTWQELVGSVVVSNRKFSRQVGADLVFRMEETFLIPSDQEFSLDFVSRSVLDIPSSSWSDASDTMSYDESCSSLGFALDREHYSVAVRVHGGTTINDLFGDCGSKNRFYFALEFENGRTGYVLANRQLGADGFRAGHNETFSIYTNRDYGELVSVRIIADDISADSIPDDRLNIDEIRVCKESNASICKEWIVKNVGWVGVGHHDVSPEDSGVGQMGRTEGELAQAYPVSGYTNAVNLEFYLNTGVYPLGEEAARFRGSIFASLEYYDNAGNRQIEEFDLIHALYRYAGLPEQYAQNADLLSNARVISDPSKMFRENHTDRFVLSLSDVSKLHKLSLRMTSNDECALNINDVSVSLVTSSGILLKNDRDEYYRNHTAEYLCSDTSKHMPSYELNLPKGEEIVHDIYFEEHNEIKLDSVDYSWVAAVSAEPESKYDEINIFVYPSDDVDGDFTLNAKVLYTDFLGRALSNEGEGLEQTVDSDGNEMYYVHGLSAAGITNLNQLQISATSEERFKAKIDHAIVQQVRNGTVITSYYFDCSQKDAADTFTVAPAADTSAQINEQQVMLMFGEKTRLANLIADERDLAVSIRYTISNDSDEREYYSEEVFITSQGYSTINDGDIVKLTFSELFVKDITGITLRTIGGLSAHIDMGCAANYNISSSTGIKEQIAWFSFANAVTAGNTEITMQRTFNQDVQPLSVTFITASAKESLESGTDDPIEMTIGYADSRGSAKETVIKNLRRYVVSEGEPFVTGSTTTVELLMKDPKELRWIELMPYDSDSSYVTGWYLLELQIELGTNGRIQRVNRRIDKYLQENNPDDYRVTLTNVTISMDVRALTQYGSYGVKKQVSSASENNVSLVGYSGQRVLFENIKLTNTTQGFNYKVERVSSDGSGAEMSGLMNAGGSSGSMSIPENYSGMQIVYRITISAKESPNAKVTVQVMVDPVEKEPEPEEDDFIVPDEDDYELPTVNDDVESDDSENDGELLPDGDDSGEDDNDLTDLG